MHRVCKFAIFKSPYKSNSKYTKGCNHTIEIAIEIMHQLI